MLLCKNLCRCHKNRRISLPCRRIHNRRRNNGLARADITLNKPVHRRTFPYIRCYLVDNPLLRSRKFKIKTLCKLCNTFNITDLRSVLSAVVTFCRTRACLKHQKLFKRKRSSCVFKLVKALGRVNCRYRFVCRKKHILIAYLLGYYVRNILT